MVVAEFEPGPETSQAGSAQEYPIEDVEGLDLVGTADAWAHYPIESVLVRSESRAVIDVVRRIRDKRMVMDPDFQRGFVWSADKQCRLIESAIMRIPLPVFYLAEQDDGRAVVVDGLQRLTTFSRYLSDEFRLKGLNKPDLRNKRFSELDSKYQNRIEDTNLVLYLIDSKVPDVVKFDIFERVNGGVPLTRQQMRNCLFSGPGTRWLSTEAGRQEFIDATGGSLDPTRMRDREVTNRFCAFSLLGVDSYRGDMDGYLGEALRRMNRSSAAQLDDLSVRFRRSLASNLAVFGRHAFRKHLPEQERRSPLNVALFDVFSTLLADFETETVLNRAAEIRNGFEEVLNKREFLDSITLGTNQMNRVKDRFRIIGNAIDEAIRHD